jgi:hypothetical protein
VRYFNAVDRNDRDSADYSTSVRTSRYYLRIFFWVLDRVVHSMYVIVCYLAAGNIGKPEWKKYMNKSTGRHDFQIALALDLMRLGLELDIDSETGEKANWIRQTPPEPCKCDMCYFCINGITDGISHKRKHRVVTTEYACGTQVSASQCSTERVLLADLKRGYCRMCYHNLPATPKLRTSEKKKLCRSTSHGCPICDEPICKSCWEKGYDKHAEKKRKVD